MNVGEKSVSPEKKDADIEVSLQKILDGLEDELLVIDNEYRIQFVNSAVSSKLQGGEEAHVGKLCYQVFQARNKPCSAPLWDCPLRKVLQSGTTTTVIHPIRKSGSDTYLKVSAAPLKDNNGNVISIVETRKDVTAERELETQILKRHHQLLALSHISKAVSGQLDLDAVLRIALDNVLEIINGAIGGILLFDESSKTLRYRIQRGLSTQYTEGMQLSPGQGIAGKVAQTGEPILLQDISIDQRAAFPDLIHAEGLRGFVSIPLKSRDGVVGVMNIASHEVGRFGADDVSLLNSIGDYLGASIEQARLYEQLRKAGERYRTLLQHALTAQEEERKRIARELHDETSQAITSLSLSLQAIIGLAEMKGFGDSEFHKQLKTVHSYAVYAGTEIVKIMKELRPTLLDELGLPAAIQRYAKDNLQAKGINLSVEFEGTDCRFPPEVEVTLFRVAQGLIGNILEHSAAKNALVRLECDANRCVLYINDDGKGFEVNKLTAVEPSGRGAGLFTVKERLKLLGGRCHIDSKPGQGTRIRAEVPLIEDLTHEKDNGLDS